MAKIIADSIDELYILQNWIESGSRNCSSIGDLYENIKDVSVTYALNSKRPHELLIDNTWNQVVGVRYTDNKEVNLVKPLQTFDVEINDNSTIITIKNNSKNLDIESKENNNDTGEV